MDEVKQLLHHASLFRGLTDTQLEQIAGIAHRETFGANDTIFEQGANGDKMYVIGSGQVKVKVKDHSGTLHAVLILGQGQVFGEMALLDQGARSAEVVAIQPDTIVYSIAEDDFKALCDADTALGYVMMRNLALDLSFKIRHQNSFS